MISSLLSVVQVTSKNWFRLHQLSVYEYRICHHVAAIFAFMMFVWFSVRL